MTPVRAGLPIRRSTREVAARSSSNNRLDSLQEIVRSPGIGLLFLVLRLDETLRVNVRAAADVAGGAGSQQTMIHLDVRVTPSGGYSQGVFSEERKASSSWMTR